MPSDLPNEIEQGLTLWISPDVHRVADRPNGFPLRIIQFLELTGASMRVIGAELDPVTRLPLAIYNLVVPEGTPCARWSRDLCLLPPRATQPAGGTPPAT